MSLLGDRYGACVKALSYFPIDRHFRTLTNFKMVMLWLRVEIFVFSHTEGSEAESTATFLKVGQILALAGSVVVAMWFPLKNIFDARRNVLFVRLFPRKVSLIFNAMVGIVVINS